MQGYEGCQNKRNDGILTDPGSNPSASKVHIQCDRVHLVHVDDGDVEVGLEAVVAGMGGRFQDLYVVSSSSSFVGSQVRVADTNLPMPEKLPRSNLWSPTSRGQDQPQWAFDEN